MRESVARGYNGLLYEKYKGTLQPSGLYTISFYYDCDDELWATKRVREKWESCPYEHPHSTLFELLYKKLEI